MTESAIDFLAVPIDPGRLERSFDLQADRAAPGSYRGILAALPREGDERVLTALRAMVRGLRALPAAA